jgi:hypothetical protein
MKGFSGLFLWVLKASQGSPMDAKNGGMVMKTTRNFLGGVCGNERERKARCD